MNRDSGRMEWLDAMRGFTMILVVAYHVAQFSFLQNIKTSASLPFLVLFRMPLFFFVSGFLSYKANFVLTPKSFFGLTWKKIKIQVFPAVIFLCVFLIFKGKAPFADAFMRCMYSSTKGGYWFTWVLLQMFVIYYIVAIISAKLRSNIPIWILWVVCLLGYLSLYMPKEFGYWYRTDIMRYMSFFQTIKFMHFFVFGNLVHRYWERSEKLMDGKWLFPLLVIIAFLSCADFFKWHFLRMEWTNLPKTLAMYSLMMIVIFFFRCYRESLSKETRIGSVLQYIGVRTLDIYLLHFIFLPKLPMVGEWLNNYHPNFVIDIIASIGISSVVIIFCLLTSNILRISPFLKEYLFGRK